MSEKVSGHSFVYFCLVLCNLKGRREHLELTILQSCSVGPWIQREGKDESCSAVVEC